ncbi:MAG: hypothetical protein ACK5LG_21975 [Bacteroides thetaiotaomicron]
MITEDQMAGMSDDEFMNMVAPVATDPKPTETDANAEAARLVAEQAAADEAAAAQAEADRLAAEAQAQEAANADAAKQQAEANKDPAVEVDPATVPDDQLKKPEVTEPETKTPEQIAAEAEAAKKEGDKEQPPTIDYQKAYEQMMAPFKANGRMIQAKTPEEAIALMQMGANYTRKMQELQPHRKTLLMLENNGLLDEGKLSYLIDLNKKDPEAIKKLLKEANIDPLTVDMEKESTYQGGNHKVTDEEVNFRLVLDDLNSSAVGKETLNIMDKTWDQASKEVLWTNPEVMTTIHAQRESGVYDRIANEVERRRVLGAIQPGTPFLHAYKVVGDEMQNAGAFNDLIKPPPAQQPTAAAPVASKVVLPKPTGAPSAQVAAAAVARPASKAEKPISVYDMSDEDLLKMPVPK